MAYLGTPIDTTNQFQSLQGKRFSGDGSTTAFTLDIAPSSVLDIEVFVENVRQDPNSAYTLNGTTLTFTGAPPSGTNNIYVVHQAKAVGTINPPAGSVTSDTLSKPFTYDDASNGSITGISVNNDFPTASTASSGTGSGIRFGVNDASFSSAFGDARGSEILSVTQQSNGRTRDIVFKTDNAGTLGEKMRILASGGITFNADTATANALDDYEEGTFTASFTGSSSTATGYYTKIGRLVNIVVYSSALSVSSAVNAQITGLPFTVGVQHAAASVTHCSYANTDGGNGYFNNGSTEFHFMFVDSLTPASTVTGTKYVMMAGAYFTS